MAPVLQLIGVITALALLPTLTSAYNNSLYAVTVSSQLTGGRVETLCAQVQLRLKVPCPICVKVQLMIPKQKKKTLILDETIESRLNSCYDFQVPDVKVRTVATISVEITGGDESIGKTSKVLIVPPTFIQFIKTDKPIYKPGQSVLFRIVSLNVDFLPVDRVFKLVELVDANSNRIAQWLDLPNDHGILDLSHPTVPEAATGTYTIFAITDIGEKITHNFEVEKFVLPKFEVIVHLPSVVTFFDKEITFRVCGKYTFGKPVVGSVKAQFCRKGYVYWGFRVPDGGASDCETFELRTDKSGCASQTVNMKEFFITNHMLIQYFEVTAEMMVLGTGSTGSAKMTLKNNIRQVTFVDVPPNYKPGLMFDVKVKLTGPDDKSIANEKVFLSVSLQRDLKVTLTTDSKGIAKHSFDTSLWEDTALVTAEPEKPKETFTALNYNLRPRYISDFHSALRFHSKSNSFVKLLPADEDLSCDRDATVRAQYITNQKSYIKFFYLVMSKGEFKQHGSIVGSVVDGVGEVSVTIGRVVNLAPVAQVIIYTLQNEEIVADSRNYPIQLCFKNKVSLKFPKLQQLPAEKTNLHLQAEPGSLCSIRAIDLSILLLEQEQELTEDYVYSQLPQQKLSGYSYDIEDNDRSSCSFWPVPIPLPRPVPLPINLPPLEVQPQPQPVAPPGPVPQPLPVAQPQPAAPPGPVPPPQPVPQPPPVPQTEPVPPPPPVPQTEPVPPPPPVPQTEPVPPPQPVPQPRPRGRRSIYPFYRDERDDVYSIFKEMGIKIVTNMDIDKPCPKPFSTAGPQPSIAFTNAQQILQAAPVVLQAAPVALQAAPSRAEERAQGGQETVRSFFPETWIWDLVTVGDIGSTSVDKTVPDTITKWVAGAFCISPVGFGVSPNTGLTAFKPFFISLNLPYSVIRGESFRLSGTFFNHLSKSIEVKVTLANSDQYTFKECEGCLYTVCLHSEESRTVTWTVTPAIIGQVSLKVSAEALKHSGLCGNSPTVVPKEGRIDTVIRELLVEAEGTPQTVSHNALLCSAGKSVKEKFSLVLPKKFVEGSVKASVSVLGDLMGRALTNVDKLLRMPYGCGEQNMLNFAPNIFITRYLDVTKQLSADIKDKAVRFMRTGYQRELNYKHRDGSYSAFGERDESGNTWLTAFVAKSFGAAKNYIYVDDNVISQAIAWLSKQQGKDGCIQSVGKLFHNAMKGGVKDEVTLTAYVTAAMLEMNIKPSDHVVKKCLRCLRKALKDKIDNLYTTALLSYTFTLAKDEKMRKRLIDELHSKSSTVGGTRHWVRAGASKSHLDSLEVEMASYVLLALLSGPVLPDFKLGYSASIVNWLVKQQNPYGGFSSTQDTVVALQALALYSSITYSEEGTTTVTVSSKKGQTIKFTVDQSNRLLLQEETLSQVPGKYTVKAKGMGCVLVQVSMRYNIPPPPDSSSFKINIKTTSECNSTRPEVSVSAEVSYHGPRPETNMVILDFKVLSGYTVVEETTQELLTISAVKRVDVEDGHTVIYLDELRPETSMQFNIKIKGDDEMGVSNLKPAVVRVYDYYQTSDEASTEYTSPCQ